MARPKAIEWLENQTGASIPYSQDSDSEPERRERHLSVRVDQSLAHALEEMAVERHTTVSQVVRELIADAVAERRSTAAPDAQALVDRLAADVAEVRRRLAG
jgi:predicted transcriptional regulator